MYVDITGLQKLMKPLLFAYSVYILTHYSVKPLNVKDKQSITMNCDNCNQKTGAQRRSQVLARTAFEK